MFVFMLLVNLLVHISPSNTTYTLQEHLFPLNIDESKSKEQQKAYVECHKEALDHAKLETLDLSDATTMYNWSLLRAFFLDFGLRFLKREEAVLGTFLLFMLIIVVVYLSLLYGGMEVDMYDAVFVICSSFYLNNSVYYGSSSCIIYG